MELKIQIFEKNVQGLLICIHLSYGTALFPTVLINALYDQKRFHLWVLSKSFEYFYTDVDVKD